MASYDVFLSHNSIDKSTVEWFAKKLSKQYGLKVWFDKWALTPGVRWQDEIEQGLKESTTIAVFLGKDGFGKWEGQEMRAAIDVCVSESSRRVIPVLLPGAPSANLSLFLKQYTWIDFRNGIKDKQTLYRFYCGIIGQQPGNLARTKKNSNKITQLNVNQKIISLRIIGDINNFDSKRQDALISAIASICQVPRNEIDLQRIYSGTIVVEIKLPAKSATFLLKLAAEGDEKLVSLGIIELWIGDERSEERKTEVRWPEWSPPRPISLPTIEPETLTNFGELPEPRQLPPGSRLLFYRNTVFTGHELDLRVLAQVLLYDSQPGALTITQALAGMGGIGKTQLAVEFCYRYGRFFEGVHWMDASQPLESEIAACGAKMNLENWPQTTPEQARLTLSVWQRDSKRLLVLDNLEEPEVLRTWKHEFEGMSLLVTSRNQTWETDLASMHTIDILGRDEGIALLRKLAPRLEKLSDEEIDLVAKRLGYLPLALDLAGRYLRIHLIMPKQYLEELDKAAFKHKSLKHPKDGSPTRHDIGVETSFLVSWSRLVDNDVDKLSKRFFIITGYLAPNIPIPRNLFYAFTTHSISLATSEFSELADDAIWRLQQLGLLTETLSVHPLLAEFARAQDVHDAILPELTGKMEKLSDQYLETELPAKFIPLRPHVETLVSFAEREGVIEAGELLDKLGTYYGIIGKYQEAYLTFERGFIFLEKSSTENFPSNIEGLVSFTANMGEMLRNLGDFPGARAKYERALEMGKNILGEEHGFIIHIMNNLGLLLRQMGNLQEARLMHERVLAIGERVYGTENENVALWTGNLGGVLHTMRDFSSAKVMYERALKIHENVYGKKHPRVAIDLNNLGVLHKDMGDYSTAEVLYERALAIQEEIFDKKHPDIALSLHNLAFVFLKLGEFSKALDYEQRALSMWQEYLPPKHPDIQKARNTLAEIEQKLER